MGTIAALEPAALRVEPGGTITSTIWVRNSGTVVDEYTFEVVGDAADWSVVEPAVLRLLPGDEAQATLTVTPPRASEAAAGNVPYGVRVASREEPASSVVEEGLLVISPFVEIAGELVPRTGTGRSSATTELAVDNLGNEEVTVDVEAHDQDQLLRFDIARPGLVIPPGQAVFSRVTVKPVDRFIRGPNKTIPFTVVVSSTEGTPPTELEGAFVQRPILPPWFFKAVLAFLVLLLLLWLLWLSLLRPAIESVARAAAEEQVNEALEVQRELIDTLARQQDAAAVAAAARQEEAQAAQEQQQENFEALAEQINEVNVLIGEQPIDPELLVTRSPLDIRLAVSAPVDGSDSDGVTVPDGETYSITDLVLQNPVGNRGQLVVSRDDEALIAVALENFRDLDYHFVAPLVFEEGSTMSVTIDCSELSTPDGTSCDAAVFFLGEGIVPIEQPPEEGADAP